MRLEGIECNEVESQLLEGHEYFVPTRRNVVVGGMSESIYAASSR